MVFSFIVIYVIIVLGDTMNIDFDKIKEIYGDDTLFEVRNNMKTVINNMNYLVSKNLFNVDDIFERYTLIFLYDENDFKNKVDKLYIKYGTEIDDNMELWEEIG